MIKYKLKLIFLNDFLQKFCNSIPNVLIWLIGILGSPHADLEIPIMPSSRSTLLGTKRVKLMKTR